MIHWMTLTQVDVHQGVLCSTPLDDKNGYSVSTSQRQFYTRDDANATHSTLQHG